jgi:cell shape-determining protein MreD
MKRLTFILMTVFMVVLMLFLVTTPIIAADSDTDVFDIEQLWYLGGVPLVLALVQLAKKWVTDTRWYPVIAIVIGIILDVVIGIVIGQPLVTSIIVGVIVGLTAGGLYSGVSTATEGDHANKANRTDSTS